MFQSGLQTNKNLKSQKKQYIELLNLMTKETIFAEKTAASSGKSVENFLG